MLFWRTTGPPCSGRRTAAARGRLLRVVDPPGLSELNNRQAVNGSRACQECFQGDVRTLGEEEGNARSVGQALDVREMSAHGVGHWLSDGEGRGDGAGQARVGGKGRGTGDGQGLDRRKAGAKVCPRRKPVDPRIVPVALPVPSSRSSVVRAVIQLEQVLLQRHRAGGLLRPGPGVVAGLDVACVELWMQEQVDFWRSEPVLDLSDGRISRTTAVCAAEVRLHGRIRGVKLVRGQLVGSSPSDPSFGSILLTARSRHGRAWPDP